MAEISQYTYKTTPGTNIRTAVENAIRMARATGKNIIIEMNNARFCVNRDTDVQTGINAYLAVQDKITKTQQQLQMHTK